jgi:hypothetical protein
MTPADADVFAIPDPSSLIQLPWKPEVGWLAADCFMAGAEVAQAPRNTLRRMVVEPAAAGVRMTRRRVRVPPDRTRRRRDLGPARPGGEALLRRRGAYAALRADPRD